MDTLRKIRMASESIEKLEKYISIESDKIRTSIVDVLSSLDIKGYYDVKVYASLGSVVLLGNNTYIKELDLSLLDGHISSLSLKSLEIGVLTCSTKLKLKRLKITSCDICNIDFSLLSTKSLEIYDCQLDEAVYPPNLKWGYTESLTGHATED